MSVLARDVQEEAPTETNIGLVGEERMARRRNIDLTRRADELGPLMTIDASVLTCQVAMPDDGTVALLRGPAIEYSAQLHDRIPGSRLFWGPYVSLRAGVYLFEFTGQIEGELRLEVAHRRGNILLKTAKLNDFDRPLCVVVLQHVRDLEVRGIKTEALRALRLESLAIHQAYRAPEGDALE